MHYNSKIRDSYDTRESVSLLLGRYRLAGSSHFTHITRFSVQTVSNPPPDADNDQITEGREEYSWPNTVQIILGSELPKEYCIVFRKPAWLIQFR